MIPFLLCLLAQDPVLESFDKTVEEFMKAREVPGGALAVVKDGKLVYAKGYGLADVDARQPVGPEFLFRIASISKPVTGVACVLLARQGKLDLDAPAFALLGLKPGPKGDKRLAAVTVRHLLQHTGGWDRDKSGDPMFDSIRIAQAAGKEPPADPDAIIQWMLNRSLDFDPGTKFSYSNFGYCVLGRIIEKVSGLTYESFVKKAVLEPMGIHRMRIGRSLESVEGEVRYYQPDDKKVRSVFPATRDREVPAPYGGFHLEAMDSHGGWLASAVDLARFATSLDKVLDEKGLELLLERPSVLKPEAWYYGAGWMVRPVGKEGRANTWHSGSLPGTNSLLVRRHDGLTWVVLFNRRSKTDGEIDPALHRAAAAVKEWPKVDLFPRYK